MVCRKEMERGDSPVRFMDRLMKKRLESLICLARVLWLCLWHGW